MRVSWSATGRQNESARVKYCRCEKRTYDKGWLSEKERAKAQSKLRARTESAENNKKFIFYFVFYTIIVEKGCDNKELRKIFCDINKNRKTL